MAVDKCCALVSRMLRFWLNYSLVWYFEAPCRIVHHTADQPSQAQPERYAVWQTSNTLLAASDLLASRFYDMPSQHTALPTAPPLLHCSHGGCVTSPTNLLAEILCTWSPTRGGMDSRDCRDCRDCVWVMSHGLADSVAAIEQKDTFLCGEVGKASPCVGSGQVCGVA